MLSVDQFLSAIEEIAAENPSYRKGGSGFDGTCDCIGLIIGAIRRCGGKWSGIHGSNWAARNEVSDLRKIASNADLSVGDLVFKAKAPGQAGYDLPSRYSSGKDKNDYYHVGVVLSVYPLRIRHMTMPAVRIDTKLGAWSHYGWCRQVEKGSAGSGAGAGTVGAGSAVAGSGGAGSGAGPVKAEGALSAADVDRLHDCLDAIEKQLDQIYEIMGGRG